MADSFLENIERTIERHRLLRTRTFPTLVGLSGGADSVALLLALHRLGISVRAAHLSHGWDQGFDEAAFKLCDDLTGRFGITLYWHVAPAEVARTETAARAWRRFALRAIMADAKCFQIALGHTRDDQVETLLYRIARGTGPTGLIGMTPNSFPYIRPLIETSRSAVERWLREQMVEWIDDPSNRDTSRRRNLIRHEILPRLEEVHPGAMSNIARLSDLIAFEVSALEEWSDRLLSESGYDTAGRKFCLAATRLRRYPQAIVYRALRRVLMTVAELDYPPDRATLTAAYEVVAAGVGRVDCAGGVIVAAASRAEGSVVVVGKTRPTPLEPHTLAIPGNVCCNDLSGMVISARVRSGRDWRHDGSLRSVVLRRASVEGPLYVRGITTGERWQPLGSPGSRKVSDYLIDRKLPRLLREDQVAVADRHGIVWLVGFDIADRVKVQNDNEEQLVLRFRVPAGPQGQRLHYPL